MEEAKPQQNDNPGYVFDPSKINKDYLLDAVTFSDDEDEQKDEKMVLDEKTYNTEMQKIESLYSQNMVDDEEGGTMNTYTGTKNEIIEKDIKEFPKPFPLTHEDKMQLCGRVINIVEGKILIENILSPTKILNLDNIIFNSNNIALAFIDDVIGNIESPIYVARIYPDLLEKGLVINKGDDMFYCENKSSFVAPYELANKHKGCDASNAFDEEINEDEMEFSDDEEEIKAKAERRRKKMFNKKMKIEEPKQNNMIINPEYKLNPSNNSNTTLQKQIEMFGNMINNAMSMNMNPFTQPGAVSIQNILGINNINNTNSNLNSNN